MYLILDKDNYWQASAPTLEVAEKLVEELKEVDRKIFGKAFTLKIVKEIEKI